MNKEKRIRQKFKKWGLFNFRVSKELSKEDLPSDRFMKSYSDKDEKIKQKMKKVVCIGMLVKLLAGVPAFAEEKKEQANPVENQFFLIDYINGLEYRLGGNGKSELKIGNTFNVGKNSKLGKLYLHGLSTGEFTVAYFKDNYSIEAAIGDESKLTFEIREGNLTAGISSDKSVHFTYLDTKGMSIGDKVTFYPYAKADLGSESLTLGALFNVGKLAPYAIMTKDNKIEWAVGLEYHTDKFMAAIRGDISKDKREARLDLQYKF